MTIKIIGTVKKAFDAISGSTDKGEWFFQSFLIETVETNSETNEQYTANVMVSCKGKEHCSALAGMKGKLVALSCNLSAKESKNGSWYNTVSVFRAEAVKTK